jgi:5-methylthioadenosine/S-adenosylhomocysteine deaminase
LGENVIAAHSVHLTVNDIQLIAGRKVGVSHNPESNMKLASGVAPIPDLQKAGAKKGVVAGFSAVWSCLFCAL